MAPKFSKYIIKLTYTIFKLNYTIHFICVFNCSSRGKLSPMTIPVPAEAMVTKYHQGGPVLDRERNVCKQGEVDLKAEKLMVSTPYHLPPTARHNQTQMHTFVTTLSCGCPSICVRLVLDSKDYYYLGAEYHNGTFNCMG